MSMAIQGYAKGCNRPDAVATLFEYARLSSTWTGHKMRPQAAYPNP